MPLWAVVKVSVAASKTVFFRFVFSYISFLLYRVVATAVLPLVAVAVAVTAVAPASSTVEEAAAFSANPVSTYNLLAGCRLAVGAPCKLYLLS